MCFYFQIVVVKHIENLLKFDNPPITPTSPTAPTAPPPKISMPVSTNSKLAIKVLQAVDE